MDDEDNGWPEQRPPSIYSRSAPRASLFFELPMEIRNKIYRYFVLSRLDCGSHPHLWRPLSVDGMIMKRIGYFERDTVIPLLLMSRKIHDEAAAILYGENTFAFHISGLGQGPIAFIEWLAPKYVRLLRNVYIRTGCYGNSFEETLDREPLPEVRRIKENHDLALSVALIKHAWPAKYPICIKYNETILVRKITDCAAELRRKKTDSPDRTFHLWKMVVTNLGTGSPRSVFKRIVWETQPQNTKHVKSGYNKSMNASPLCADLL